MIQDLMPARRPRGTKTVRLPLLPLAKDYRSHNFNGREQKVRTYQYHGIGVGVGNGPKQGDLRDARHTMT